MAKPDVIQAFFDSYALIRSHWKEVAPPLLALVLLSGAGHFGGGSLSSFQERGSFSPYSHTADSLVAGAMGGAELLQAGLAGGLALLIVAAIIAAAAFAIVDRALWFYVYEHFYAILKKKKKIREDWKARMKRHLAKAAVFLLFWLLLLAAAFALPMLSLATSQPLHVTLALFAIGVLCLLQLGFLLSPLWIYYAMEGHGLGASVRKSVSLVGKNLLAFTVFFSIALLLEIGSALAMVTSACCCLSWVVAPLLTFFLSLLTGVALMKIKMAIEK